MHSPADAAHLFVAVGAVDVGLQADAVGHGLGQGRLRIGRGQGRAEDRADVDFTAFEQAGAEDAVGGEAEAIQRLWPAGHTAGQEALLAGALNPEGA